VKLLSDESGNSLLEGVGFAAVAFGLLLSLGMNALSLEREELALSAIARNAMRSYLLHSSTDLHEAVAKFQQDSVLATQPLQISISCANQDCVTKGNLIWLYLSTDELSARAFGVISE
jgi:hypothetical protein